MEKTKHTPGPWLLCDSGAHNCYAVHADDASCIVAYTMPRFKVTKQHAEPAKPSDEDQANARLIAAAPELLDALEGVCEALEVTLSRLGVCGLGDGKDHKVDESSWGGTSELQGARAAIAKARGE